MIAAAITEEQRALLRELTALTPPTVAELADRCGCNQYDALQMLIGLEKIGLALPVPGTPCWRLSTDGVAAVMP